MNSKNKKINTTHAAFITLGAVIIIFMVAFAFGKKNNTETETATQTGETIGVCTREYNPVCGENGVEYMNSCLADLAKVSYKNGRCEENTLTPSNTSISDSDIEGEDNMCPAIYNPVCGKDGNTYGNDCQARVAKIEVAHEGVCTPKKNTEIKSTQTTSSASQTTNNETSTAPVTPKTEATTTGATLPSENEATATGNLSNYDEKKYHLYSNEGVGYSFAFPKNTSYRGFGPRDGAQHTLAISTTATGSESFDTADVKIYYYKNTPANPPSSESITLENGSKVYIVNENATPASNAIVNTIKESIK